MVVTSFVKDKIMECLLLKRASRYALTAFTLLFTLVLASSLFAQNATPGASGIFRRTKPQQPAQVAPASPSPAPSAVKAEDESGSQGIGQSAPPVSEVDQAEILRRGDRVVKAGVGPMAPADQLLGDATSPPPDDSHKWYFSVLVDDGPDSKALLADIRKSQYLRAWINLDEPKDSWSHATVYKAGDNTQDWRWKNIKVTKLPVMILQPPTKLRDERNPVSWEWGDPKTVVWQWDGYQSGNPQRDLERSNAVRKALQLYVTRLSSSPRFVNATPGPRSRAVPPPTPGPRQDAGMFQQQPPFSFPSPTPVQPQPPSNPFFPQEPSPPFSQPQANPSGMFFQLLMGLLGGGGMTNTLLIVIAGMSAIRTFRKATGQKLLLDDAAYQTLQNLLRSLTGTNPPK
jgi:hypothetical protein